MLICKKVNFHPKLPSLKYSPCLRILFCLHPDTWVESSLLGCKVSHWYFHFSSLFHILGNFRVSKNKQYTISRMENNTATLRQHIMHTEPCCLSIQAKSSSLLLRWIYNTIFPSGYVHWCQWMGKGKQNWKKKICNSIVKKLIYVWQLRLISTGSGVCQRHQHWTVLAIGWTTSNPLFAWMLFTTTTLQEYHYYFRNWIDTSAVWNSPQRQTFSQQNTDDLNFEPFHT